MTYNYINDIRDGNLTAIQTNITNASEADTKGYVDEYPICLAVRFNQVSIYNYLVSIGADIDLVGDDGYAAIHWAVVNNNSTMLDSLISSGVNVDNPQTTTGGRRVSPLNTPLHLSSSRGFDTISQKLIDAGVNVDTFNKINYTPLHLCVKRNHATTTQTLIDAGANVDVQNDLQNTPLHLSSIGDYTIIAQKLIDAGADKTITNNEDATAADISSSAEMDVILA